MKALGQGWYRAAGAGTHQAEGSLGSGLQGWSRAVAAGLETCQGTVPGGVGRGIRSRQARGELEGAALRQLSCVEGVRGVAWSGSCQRPSRAAPHRGH